MTLKEYAYKILRHSQALEKNNNDQKLLDEKQQLLDEFKQYSLIEIENATPRVRGWLKIYFPKEIDAIEKKLNSIEKKVIK